jgi:hypothetical protein
VTVGVIVVRDVGATVSLVNDVGFVVMEVSSSDVKDDVGKRVD